jgi:hypothetical protein
MSPSEKGDVRKIWYAVIGFIILSIVSQIIDIPSRVNGMNGKIKELELTKMSKDDASEFFRQIQVLEAQKNATWDQYMISNEKDKERILGDIETIQEDIKILIGKNRTVTRSVPQQSSGGKAIAPNK